MATSLPAHYHGDPMAAGLARCGLAIAEIDDLVERASLHEYLAGMARQDAEALASGGESYSA